MPDEPTSDTSASSQVRDRVLGVDPDAVAAIADRLTLGATDEQLERMGASARIATQMPESMLGAVREAQEINAKALRAFTGGGVGEGITGGAFESIRQEWLDSNKVHLPVFEPPEPWHLEVPEVDFTGIVTMGDVVEAIEGQQATLVDLVEEARLSRQFEVDRWAQAQADQRTRDKADARKWKIELTLLVIAILVGVASIIAAG